MTVKEELITGNRERKNMLKFIILLYMSLSFVRQYNYTRKSYLYLKVCDILGIQNQLYIP